MSDETRNPNELIAAAAKPRLTVSLIISFAVHILLLLVLSIGFIRLCVHYKTVRPKDAIKQEQKLQEEAEKKKAQEDRLKAAQLKAREEAEKEKKEDKKQPAAQQAAEKKQADRPKSEVEKKLEETLPPESAKGSMEEGLSF